MKSAMNQEKNDKMRSMRSVAKDVWKHKGREIACLDSPCPNEAKFLGLVKHYADEAEKLSSSARNQRVNNAMAADPPSGRKSHSASATHWAWAVVDAWYSSGGR